MRYPEGQRDDEGNTVNSLDNNVVCPAQHLEYKNILPNIDLA